MQGMACRAWRAGRGSESRDNMSEMLHARMHRARHVFASLTGHGLQCSGFVRLGLFPCARSKRQATSLVGVREQAKNPAEDQGAGSKPCKGSRSTQSTRAHSPHLELGGTKAPAPRALLLSA
eukprot:40843-Chlamydomonas_euryale.AAC.6